MIEKNEAKVLNNRPTVTIPSVNLDTFLEQKDMQTPTTLKSLSSLRDINFNDEVLFAGAPNMEEFNLSLLALDQMLRTPQKTEEFISDESSILVENEDQVTQQKIKGFNARGKEPNGIGSTTKLHAMENRENMSSKKFQKKPKKAQGKKSSRGALLTSHSDKIPNSINQNGEYQKHLKNRERTISNTRFNSQETVKRKKKLSKKRPFSKHDKKSSQRRPLMLRNKPSRGSSICHRNNLKEVLSKQNHDNLQKKKLNLPLRNLHMVSQEPLHAYNNQNIDYSKRNKDKTPEFSKKSPIQSSDSPQKVNIWRNFHNQSPALQSKQHVILKSSVSDINNSKNIFRNMAKSLNVSLRNSSKFSPLHQIRNSGKAFDLERLPLPSVKKTSPTSPKNNKDQRVRKGLETMRASSGKFEKFQFRSIDTERLERPFIAATPAEEKQVPKIPSGKKEFLLLLNHTKKSKFGISKVKDPDFKFESKSVSNPRSKQKDTFTFTKMIKHRNNINKSNDSTMASNQLSPEGSFAYKKKFKLYSTISPNYSSKSYQTSGNSGEFVHHRLDEHPLQQEKVTPVKATPMLISTRESIFKEPPQRENTSSWRCTDRKSRVQSKNKRKLHKSRCGKSKKHNGHQNQTGYKMKTLSQILSQKNKINKQPISSELSEGIK